MRTIDDFLIDRLFQPAADRLARWMSCYAIAEFLLTGELLFKTISYAAEQDWVAMSLCSAWMPVYILRAHRLDAAPPSDILPTERVTGIVFRMIWLTVQIVTLPINLLEPHALWWRIESASWWLIVAGVYLMACRKRPPKPKRITIPFGAVLTRSSSQ